MEYATIAQSHNRTIAQSHNRTIALSLIACFALSVSSAIFAAPQSIAPLQSNTSAQSQNQKWSIFGGLGYMNYITGTSNNTFAVTSSETDQLSQSSQNNNLGYTLGFARDYTINKPALSDISIGFTLRYDPTTFTGQVEQYQDPTQNNFTSAYKVRPITELAESNFYFPTIEKIHTIPFAIVGVGLTEANLDFQETVVPNSGAINPINTSAWKTTGDLAVGAGLKWLFKQNYFFKAQYLFQYRGTVTTGNVPVNLNEQGADILFGYQF